MDAADGFRSGNVYFVPALRTLALSRPFGSLPLHNTSHMKNMRKH